MAKKVRDAMTVEPRSAEPGLSLAEAAQLMKSEDVGLLPVVDDGHLVAVLTDRDIVVRAVEQDRLVGIVAQADVAHEVKAKQVGEVVEEISKPTGVES